MSSTPLSLNVIRSPNGAPPLSNKTNPSARHEFAASQTRDQHIIVIRLLLFVYMKTQGSAFRLCVSKADITGIKWKLSVKMGAKSEEPHVVLPSYLPSLYIST